jgi:uncharacterized delta-60 repeat protein
MLGVLFAQDFRITSVQVTNNDVRLTWSAPGGSNYIVQSATRLTGTPGTNFSDLPGSPIYSSLSGPQSASYTHVGGLLNSTSRFYRVRSVFAPPILQIQPTNVVMAPGMTNRYKAIATYPDNSMQDVTSSVALVSSNAAVAQVLGLSNAFLLVRALTNGSTFLQASYQGATNAVSLNVTQLVGLYTTTNALTNYVTASNPPVRVMGVFANGRTNNITLASNPAGPSTNVTSVTYNVAPDVANSYALITGQSAANCTDSCLWFQVGGTNTANINVQWCEYVSVTLLPKTAQIIYGYTQPFSVYGYRFDGTFTNLSADVSSFTSSDSGYYVLTYRNPLGVLGNRVGGPVTITATVNNDVNCGTLFDTAEVTVISPPVISSQPTDQIVAVGDNATFSVSAFSQVPVPLAYQWQFNGSNTLGATSSSLVVSNASYAQQGAYRVVITNVSGFGCVTSSPANLTVAHVGVPLWTNIYYGPVALHYPMAIAVDAGGNALVTGTSSPSGSDHYSTIKYSSAGMPLWTNRYNGPGNGNDYATAIAVDTNGNVFVTGYSSGTNSYLAYATIKYSSAGLPLWTNRFSGPGNGHDEPSALAVDSSGSVVVTGYSTSVNGDDDYTTIKYSNVGVALWTNSYDGPAHSYDYATAVAVDTDGNVFVTGYSYGVGSGYNFATIKYSGTGLPLWTNRYNGPKNGNDYATAIAVDYSGGVFVTGRSTATNGNYDYATIKWSNAGVPLWTNRYKGPGNGDNYATALVVDTNGNVVVTGYSTGVGSSYDYATIKYSNAGVPLWTNRYNGPASGADEAQAMAVDGSGNVLVTGYSSSTSGYYDYAMIKYSPAGAILWLSRYPNGFAYATAVDGAGNLLVTGQDYNGGFVTLKYPP